MNKIINPIYNTIVNLQQNNNCILDNSDFQMLLKNFQSNLKRVFLGTILISEIQNDNEAIQKYSDIIGAEFIEYVYQKITTVWDISYQIGNMLLDLKKSKNGNKYSLLQEEFDKKSQKKIDFKWYKQLSDLRNRLTHGGLNIIPFFTDNRIKFQIYNNDVDESIEYNDFYNEKDNQLIYADYYFTYYTVLLYNYLCDFFNFVNSQLPINAINSCQHPTFAAIIEQLKYIDFPKSENFFLLIENMNKNNYNNQKYNFSIS